MALDAEGNLVIIENKRDDTGKDVVWQAINYASFCSTLTSEEIIKIYSQYLQKNNIDGDAEQLIKDFFEDESIVYPTNTQKIILVAKEFRKEVLSAAQWLNSNGIDITCLKLTPYKFNGDILLEVDRILPQEEIRDYTLKLAQKSSDTKNQTFKRSKAEQRNLDFWKFFSEQFDRKDTLFENITAWTSTKVSWIGASAGYGHGLSYNFVISSDYCRVELYIDNKHSQEYNKAVYDLLYAEKESIEADLNGYDVKWGKLENKRASRISIETYDFTMENKDDWKSASTFLINAMNAFTKTLDKYKTIVNNYKLV